MRNARVELPRVHRAFLRGFGVYTAWYLQRHFHAVRVSGLDNARVPSGRPLVVVMNHPSWWDPLIALTLALRFFPERTHYAPIDAKALQKYKFFARIGFFGVEQEAVSGAATFLRIGEAILRTQSSALWITAQGAFTDPRQRPVTLKSGLEHLLQRVPEATVLPVAVEYPFWEERTPEALVRIDPPAEPGSDLSRALERAQDRLASDSVARRVGEFETLISGKTGVGGLYDLWRSAASLIRGRRFDPSHGDLPHHSERA